MRPGLARGVRLVHDPVRGVDALLYPEGSLLLDGPAPDVLRACDGRRDTIDILTILSETYEGVSADDVADLLGDLAGRRLLVDGGRPARVVRAAGSPADDPDRRPIGMVAELTYRCPLRCGYCSNPVQASGEELDTAAWIGVLEQARALGVLQVHFSGGEPALRPDLPELAGRARALGMYTNLVTSGVGLSASRLADIDHVQLSVQDASAVSADAIAGLRAHDRKIAAAALVRAAGLPLTVNVVLHAANVERVAEIAAFAVGLGAERLELAHTQFYGWGLLNRAALMPTVEQVGRADRAAQAVRKQFGSVLEIVYVQPDYHTGRPKPCMNGWASRQFAVAPDGVVLPCLAARQLPGPAAPSVREQGLADIWSRSELFERFRGTAWMPSPCRSCELREVDFGGCRCQAFQVTGDAAATDPACALSPDHDRLVAATAVTTRPAMIPRRYR
ncbi:pyrroloquinoline quinone biosynthesis protein PqqE [Actinoplanes sp. HUAS TT8]|uniref:pyrroloquinoline quinone biosynthesis protein PqqE n=1 Tax=Actinoplanes sp. HUAS TT8 TaxID=3447453 RepID=UPI003F5244F2